MGSERQHGASLYLCLNRDRHIWEPFIVRPLLCGPSIASAVENDTSATPCNVYQGVDFMTHADRSVALSEQAMTRRTLTLHPSQSRGVRAKRQPWSQCHHCPTEARSQTLSLQCHRRHLHRRQLRRTHILGRLRRVGCEMETTPLKKRSITDQ
jgi:hypothetical protein